MTAVTFGPTCCSSVLVPKSKLLHSPEAQYGFVPKHSLHGGKNIGPLVLKNRFSHQTKHLLGFKSSSVNCVDFRHDSASLMQAWCALAVPKVQELFFRLEKPVFLLSLISKHEMLCMGLVMADGKFTYRQTASAADANLVKIEINERVFDVFVNIRNLYYSF